ncbi:hypothetical protein [Dyella sp. 20L07]|uniref:hypothetical protein n=1 Tax=Dyella sp. 20L07 TaxID=3384240 RepID=UPI003D288985
MENIRKKAIFFGFLYLLSAQTKGSDFCEESMATSLDSVLLHTDESIGKRIQAHVILRTDAKEYTRISVDEGSHFSILTTADDDSGRYYKSHDLSSRPHFDVIDDLFDKLRAAEGARFSPDMRKIQYYRQNVTICGRLVRSVDGLRFAVDDMRIENSYLLPRNGGR